MKLIVAVVLTVSIAASFIAPGPSRVVTYGTSLTAGGMWQDDLQKNLSWPFKNSVEVVNLGASGEGSTYGLANVDKVIAAKPDTVTIEFAINDSYEPIRISLAKSRENTKAIVTAIKEALPDCRVFLMTTSPANYKGGMHRDLPAYFQNYRELATELNVGLIDLYPRWLEVMRPELMPDGAHPTPEGYKLIAPDIAWVGGWKSWAVSRLRGYTARG